MRTPRQFCAARGQQQPGRKNQTSSGARLAGSNLKFAERSSVGTVAQHAAAAAAQDVSAGLQPAGRPARHGSLAPVPAAGAGQRTRAGRRRQHAAPGGRADAGSCAGQDPILDLALALAPRLSVSLTLPLTQRDGGGSTLRLAVALTPEAATLPPLGLGAAQPPAASATQPPASSAAGAAAAGRTLEAEAKAEAKAQASRLAAQAAAVAGAEREGKG